MNRTDTAPSDAAREAERLRAEVARLTERVQHLENEATRPTIDVISAIDLGAVIMLHGRVLHANAAARALVHTGDAELEGLDLVPLLHPEDQIKTAAYSEARHSTGTARGVFELRIKGVDDPDYRWFDCRMAPLDWHGLPATLCVFSDITERVGLMTELTRTQNRFRKVVEHISQGMVVVRDTICVYANPQAYTLTGATTGQLLGQGYLRFVHPDDMALLEAFRHAQPSGTSAQRRIEVRLQRPDGRTRWIEVGMTVVPWDGQPATLVFFLDITDRKALEEQLHVTLRERETVLQHSMLGIVFFTAQGRVRWANRAVQRLFAVPEPDTVVSMEPFYPSRAEYLALGKEASRCILAGRDFQSEQEMLRSDGSRFWAFLSGRALDPTEPEQGSVWVVMDISQRKALESALQRNSREREAILNNTLVGISYNIDRHVQWVNDKYLEMTGYHRSEVTGQSSRMFYDTVAEYETDGAAIEETLRNKSIFASERQLKRRDGSTFWAVLSGRCLEDRKPENGVIWTMLDVTDRRKAEEDMRTALSREVELNALRSRFVAMTSHEFRTPLATILSSAELLRHYADRLSAEDRLETLEGIEQAVQRMTRMLERVLLIGRSDADMLEFAPTALNLDNLCRALMSEAMAQQPPNAPQIVYRFNLAQPVGRYDEKLLRHIFSNLLSNALKYSPQGEPVQFSISAADDQVVFEVRDRGIGIPAEEIGHLFKSFHRASNVGNIPGTGLGLSIVKKSVELHGGTIEVSSQTGHELGHGTCFTVRL